ncbi:MAG: ATP-binding cassette domain-containing protein [Caldilineaceae bacterium]|nr:ATP-binding cassette domain-containing protein [Caldilineaceae bacterium]
MQQGIELQAKEIDVCRRGKLILRNASFTIQPGTLTAIIGPNGAGKTTLMRALSGERPDGGQVLINGEDIYADPEYWLQQVGYVPVDNILHEYLTLYEALIYIGRLRLPHATEAEIAQKADRLLTEFDFPSTDARRNRPIKVLSSGERKRANICSELLIDPPLLMLDEPTSNLDPDAERNLMHLLAEYAHNNGQTILVITHTLNTIDVCDEVIFIENSQLRAAGKRQEVLETLESQIPEADPTAPSFYRWAEIFEHFKTRNEHLKCSKNGTPRSNHKQSQDRRSIPTATWFYQLRLLLNRYTKVRLGDQWSLVGTLMAGLSGLLFFILPAETFIKPHDPSEWALALVQARQSVYVVCLVVTLIGLITSYTEISKEFRIYRHERLKGLSPSAYFMSKWIWLTAAVGILAPILLIGFIVLVYQQPLPDFPEPRWGEEVTWWDQLLRFQLVGLVTTSASRLILVTLILACISSVTLGLLISTLAGDSDKGYLYLSFVVVFIVLFSGLIRNDKLEDLIETFSFASTGKWAYEGMASSLSIYCWLDSWHFDEFNSTGHILSVWLALGIFILVAGFFAILVLRMRDPWYGRWSNLRLLAIRDRSKLAIYFSVLILLLSYTLFLRQVSHDYYSLTYWSRGDFGGSNAFEYAHVDKMIDPTLLQTWNSKMSQSWCGDLY